MFLGIILTKKSYSWKTPNILCSVLKPLFRIGVVLWWYDSEMAWYAFVYDSELICVKSPNFDSRFWNPSYNRLYFELLLLYFKCLLQECDKSESIKSLRKYNESRSSQVHGFISVCSRLDLYLKVSLECISTSSSGMI